MAIATGDVIRAAAVLTDQNTGQVVNVFHVKCVNDAGQPQVDLRDDIADYLEDVYDSIVARITALIAFTTIELFNVTDGTPEPSVAWPALVAGTDAGSAMPAAVAPFSIARTGLSRVIGRKFWPRGSEDSYAGGRIEAAPLAQYVLAATDWITPFTGGSTATWDPGVYSRASALFHVFTEAVTENVPAYQRRRKPGVGA